MGILDKTTHKLTCPQCGMSEVATVLDRGSEWSGPCWQEGPAMQQFHVKWHGSDKTEPTITTATCKKCGVPATVTFSS